MNKKPKFYIKNAKGRYEEYKEPVQDYDNKLYRKVGNRYEPCDMLVTQSLSEGVWVVTKHKSSKSYASGKYLLENFMCLKASDIQEVSLAKLGGMEKLAHYLSQHWDELPTNASQYERCQAIVGLLFKYENHNES